MHLYDLLDLDEMTELTRDGYVREQFHPSEPLAILNYSDKAQIEGQEFWEKYPSLSYCRGLIYNTDDGEIVARPFPKFWNYGQGAAAQIKLDEAVTVTDKLDGSLGIMYREPNGGELAIATRGSFTSEQALHATDVLRRWYGMIYSREHADPRTVASPADNETFLFEIIYPANRIVVNYHGIDDLYILGSVDLEDGYIFTPGQAAAHLDWPGPRAGTLLKYKTLADALAAPPRPNREGVVVSTTGGARMVKIKQDDYVALHRIVTGLSERRVWQALMAGQTVDQINEPLPDEFHPWVFKVAVKLIEEFNRRQSRQLDQFWNAMAIVRANGWASADGDGGYDIHDRKSIALLFQETDEPWAMFALLDGRDTAEKVWKQLEPVGDVRPNTTEEV